MKKGYLIMASLLMVGVILTGTVMALFSFATKAETNILTRSYQSSELVEVVYEMRGSVLHKEPYVINTGNAPCLVRAQVIVDPEELCCTSIHSAPSEAQKESLLADGYRFWIKYNSDWKYEGGYWYYQGVLDPGEDTPPIFTTVNWLNVDEDGNWLDHQNFNIYVSKETVFTEGVLDSGEKISALDSDGEYDNAKAKNVWDVYAQ